MLVTGSSVTARNDPWRADKANVPQTTEGAAMDSETIANSSTGDYA
jgi:hypothetical protein